VSFDKDKDKDAATGAVTLTRVGSGIVEWQRTFPGWATLKSFSPDGKSIAVLCGGQSIRLLDTETGAVKHEIPTADSPKGGRGNDFAIAPQGSLLAIGGIDTEKNGFVELWDLGGASAERPELPKK
jgi:WD40 repeat protein